jgi:hypothetical protein
MYIILSKAQMTQHPQYNAFQFVKLDIITALVQEAALLAIRAAKPVLQTPSARAAMRAITTMQMAPCVS